MKNTTMIAVSFALVLATACGTEFDHELEEVGQNEQALSLTDRGNSVNWRTWQGSIKNHYSNLCLDAQTYAPVQTYCNNRNYSTQDWKYVGWKMINQSTGKCLAGYGGRGGKPIMQNCYNTRHQQWSWDVRRHTLRNWALNLCLTGVGRSVGAKPYFDYCNSDNIHQRWQ